MNIKTAAQNPLLNIEIITPQAEHIHGLRSLWKEAFGDSDAFLDTFFSTAFSPNRCLCMVCDNHVVAALYWFECEYEKQPLAYIYAVATAKSYRGRGLCHQLLNATHSKLKQQCYIGALLVPGSTSLFDFYARAGYETTCYRQVHKATIGTLDENSCFKDTLSAASIFTLTQINAHEYAMLRRKYLPANSVIQEKENLSFLQTQLHFYSSENLLLAARIDGNTLYGVELLCLGNAIPNGLKAQLLSYFDCSNGIFYTPGQNTPFAMYYPLTNNLPAAPSYFGFAFD